ncbi:hypothetical protein SAMN06296036_106225 [Pseudobacteriovorax antillogorgiicola]|uniref:Uncharacterized protein n=1 Tax=Pseudobacteriovorax antillogorgiicola TaxID=1513793 RepID=A0A1Y6BSN4_9BACT|nr:hypothetical protein EDD56_10618 [Pseudobacteriovorax antillogorgiicola]SMF19006.1 hypothetical protein SAMN06296036_106225 [Pseudobacteriovorax antillogorgiicola]
MKNDQKPKKLPDGQEPQGCEVWEIYYRPSWGPHPKAS